MKSVIAVSLLLALAACAGRNPEPIEVRQSADRGLSCPMIEAEMDGNKGRIAELVKEDDEASDMNITIGALAAGLFPPALLASDVSDAQEVEISALHDRNSHLETLRVHRGCVTADLVPQGFTGFARGTSIYSDADGRRIELRSNNYIYEPRQPLATATPPSPAQVGQVEIAPLY